MYLTFVQEMENLRRELHEDGTLVSRDGFNLFFALLILLVNVFFSTWVISSYVSRRN